jgi:hypothetical protein
MTSVTQMRDRHSPRLANRLVAPRHADVSQMPHPMKCFVISDEKFSAPDRSIGTESGAIERHTDDRLVQAVLRHTTRHVGMVMLDRD